MVILTTIARKILQLPAFPLAPITSSEYTMTRLTIILVLCAFIISVLAASPPLFCKCTCFTNSIIIPLPKHPSSGESSTRALGSTCASCNKEFCKEHRLPFCEDAEDKDRLTICFQRDSRKDQIVVLTFITTTLGLLIWAAVRKVLEKRETEGVRIGSTQQGYAAVEGR